MSNLSTLEQNVLHALGGAAIDRDGNILAFECPEILDEMEQIFLRWKDRSLAQAERCALEWAVVASFLSFALPAAVALHKDNQHAVLTPEQTVSEVREFCKQRLIRKYFPNNTTDRVRG